MFIFQLQESTNTTSKPNKPLKHTDPSVDSVKKEFLDCSADILHNLLGVESSAIEKMLDSASADSAAKFLGVAEGCS